MPKTYAPLFRGAAKLLASHRGWDIGALAVARGLARRLDVPLYFATTTRLLVDLNRSLHVKGVWSDRSKQLDAVARDAVIHRYYQPYRNSVEQHLKELASGRQRVLHLSLHSFTPVLNGETRNAEVGILYDPKRAFEARLARALCAAVRSADQSLRVRKNYPYVGYTDGFTTYLRKHLAATRYAGIEIETKQDLIATAAGQRRFIDTYARAIRALQHNKLN